MSAAHDTGKPGLIRAASYASVAVALTLVIAKVWAWQATGSIAMLSSLADSILDVIASLITFTAVRVALQPADSEHRFGHGKAEGLAALAQALIVGTSAVYVCYEAMMRFVSPEPLRAPEAGAAIMGASLVLTIGLVFFQRYVIERTRSVAIQADALHYKADIAVNAGVLVTIGIVAMTGWQTFDPMVGLVIAAYILLGAVQIGRESLHILLDREIDETDRRRIEAIAMDHPQIVGFHDLRTRSGGTRYFLQFHLEMDPKMDLTTAHEIMDEVEERILEIYPGSEIIIHADPEGVTERRDTFD